MNRARLTPVELAEFDDALDSYTKALLREMVHGKKEPKDPYGYEQHRKMNRLWWDSVKESADEYRRKYENNGGGKVDASSDDLKN